MNNKIKWNEEEFVLKDVEATSFKAKKPIVKLLHGGFGKAFDIFLSDDAKKEIIAMLERSFINEEHENLIKQYKNNLPDYLL